MPDNIYGHRSADRQHAVTARLTARQAQILKLITHGLASKEVARQLAISVRTVENHLRAMREQTGTHSQSELVVYAMRLGLLTAEKAAVSKPRALTTEGGIPTATLSARPWSSTTCNGPTARSEIREGIKQSEIGTSGYRLGYVRVGSCSQEQQTQLDAMIAAGCHEVVIEMADVFDDRPELSRVLKMLHADSMLLIYEPNAIASSMEGLLSLLEGSLRPSGISLHVLAGPCAGLHYPKAATGRGQGLFAFSTVATQMRSDLAHEITLKGLRNAQVRDRKGGRPTVMDSDVISAARTRCQQGESVAAIARQLGVSRSTLYRALRPNATPQNDRC